jgi:hypothetical protein
MRTAFTAFICYALGWVVSIVTLTAGKSDTESILRLVIAVFTITAVAIFLLIYSVDT